LALDPSGRRSTPNECDEDACDEDECDDDECDEDACDEHCHVSGRKIRDERYKRKDRLQMNVMMASVLMTTRVMVSVLMTTSVMVIAK